MPVLFNNDVIRKAQELLSKLNESEKVNQLRSQMTMSADLHTRDFTVGHVRNIAHFAHSDQKRLSPSQCAEILNEDQKKSLNAGNFSIPVLQNGEALHGAQWGDATCFPQCIGLAAAWNRTLMKQVACVIADELSAVGIRQALAPVANISRDPRWGRTQETFGEDPYLASMMCSIFVKSLQNKGIICTPKHFVANYGDGGRDSNAVDISDRLLREVYLPPFEACIKAGAMSIMPAYNSLNGLPCSCSEYLLKHILRNEWNFQGYVVSDYGAVKGIFYDHHAESNHENAAERAFKAGLDLELPTGGDFLLNLRNQGRLKQEQIDEAVLRVLQVKIAVALMDNPFVEPSKANDIVQSSKHKAICLDAAKQGVVLLKNEKNALPLKKGVKRIGVFGTLADVLSLGDYSGPFGGWRGTGITPLKGIIQAAPASCEINYFGIEYDNKAVRFLDAAVIFTGVNESEGADRCCLGLPNGHSTSDNIVVGSDSQSVININGNQQGIEFGNQHQMILKLSEYDFPLVVVLLTGSAVTPGLWFQKADAVLEAWYPGQLGGLAIAEILFGRYNPAGRLPITFPHHEGQLPLYYNYKPSGRGYGYCDHDGKPFLPFGYGLSFTNFQYSDLKLSKKTISPGDSIAIELKVENIGPLDGDEVIQIYLRDEVSSFVTPFKKLVGFDRIHLKKGSTQRYQLDIRHEQMQLLNIDNNPIIEPGTFTLYICRNAETVVLQESFQVI